MSTFKKLSPVLVLVIVGGIALAQEMVDQGSPGKQGPWPVSMTTLLPDGGTSSGTAITPQICNTMASKITSVGVAAGATPATQLTARRYVTLCNSLQNSGTPLVKCRSDGTAPVMAATNIGDVMGVGDCILYPAGDGTAISCIADAAATYVTSWECSG